MGAAAAAFSGGDPRERLAVALDVPDLEAARALIRRLAGAPGWLKVGAELFTAAGPAAVELARREARVFLDTKLHDVPNQVAGAVAAATSCGVSMLTLHASGGAAMLAAAREAAERAAAGSGVERPLLVAVTVLTSLSGADLRELGLGGVSAAEQVLRLAELARASGLDGVVASALEVARIRERAGPSLRLVVPGIRPRGWPADDQRRTAGAGEAIRAGADLLVVGRPILAAPDPERAARDLLAEIGGALGAAP
jgi:orotidine-5'-phosphate decarboxylase